MGHQHILTPVDYTTRYPDAVPHKSITTEEVVEGLVSMYSALGVPEEILSNLGMQFVSGYMREVPRLWSIKQMTTTSMCNGLTEKFNGTLKRMLNKMCIEQPQQWHQYIIFYICLSRSPAGIEGFLYLSS